MGARQTWDAPAFVAFAGLRAPTPSLNATPCPNVLGRLEWVGGAEGVVAEGAGDCGRVDGAVEVFAGGGGVARKKQHGIGMDSEYCV